MKTSRSSSARGTPGKSHRATRERGPVILFDLDGTLVDAVYDHVLSWQQALETRRIQMPCWRIHRQIGLSGKAFLPLLFRQMGLERKEWAIDQLERVHGEIYRKRIGRIRPLPGARELLGQLSEIGIPWAIGTSGEPEAVEPMLKMLRVPRSAPVVLARDLERGKPNPDVFTLAAQKLGVQLSDAIVVGDSVWDLLAAQRGKALGVGLLSGGYGQDELERAGAFRTYADPADLLRHLEELGISLP